MLVTKIPGSKSILQRLMVLAAHAKADITVENYNPCGDVLELAEAMKVFGYSVTGQGAVRSFRFDPQSFAHSTHHYRFQYSATAFRLWLSLLANLPGINSEIELSDILHKRGFAPLQDALTQLGAALELTLPLIRIQASALAGGMPELNGSISSQFHSSLILAAPFMQKPLTLNISPEQVSMPYLKLSLQMLKRFRARVEERGTEITISRASFRLPGLFCADSDLSTAAYYAVWGALHAEGIRMEISVNPGLTQADAVIFRILSDMGAGVSWEANYCSVYPGALRGKEICLKDNPDLMPVLSILALFCQSPCRLKGIGRLAHKESDRVAGIVDAFKLIGANFTLGADELIIMPLGARELPQVTLDTRSDHRLVMAFSLLQSRYPQIALSETASLSKSLPLGSLITNLARS